MNDDAIHTNIPGFTLRFANEADCGLILEFIKALADYEKMSDQVMATEARIRQSVFENRQADVLIGEYAGEPVAFAVIFYPYSTFIGGVYLYLEDLFVKPDYRNKGFGKEIFRCLAGIAVERGYQRMDWACLDWNVNSIAFYRKLGAVPMDEWTNYRLTGEALRKLGE